MGVGLERAWEVPSKVAIFKARSRLGREPLELLFGAVAAPLASESTRGAFYRGLRLMSLDGTCLDVADTPANEAAFGRPGSRRGQGGGAFPQLRLVGAVGVRDARDLRARRWARTPSSEQALADQLLGALGSGMLCLADRGFYSFERFQNARQSGAQLLWRVKSNMVAPARAAAPGRLLSDARLRQPAPIARCRSDEQQGTRGRVPARRPRAARTPSSATGCLPRSSTPSRRPLAELGRALPRALGDRGRPRRAQDPPARPPRRAALQTPRRRLPGGLRLPLHPLRDPAPHARRRPPGRPRPRPLIVHPRPPRRPPQHPHPAGIFPPTALHAAHQQAIAEILAEPLPNAASAPTPASSNARCPTGPSNAPNTATGHNQPSQPSDAITILAA